MKVPQRETLLAKLKTRFESNRARHPSARWEDVKARLTEWPEKLESLYEMERTGGEPDVVGGPDQAGAFTLMDCAAETPAGRRSVCYDREARESRKEHAPALSAMEMASAMGGEILTEEQYRALQALGIFDTKTSSWLKTPEAVRKLGGALFGDRRYDRVFVYHNGAQSYYAARAFRVRLTV